MGQAAVPLMIATTAASGYMQHEQHKSAGIAAKNEGKRVAEQEQAQLREEQIERRERLIRALSSQTAAVGASGGQLSGSALKLMEEDQKQFEQEDFRARLSGAGKVNAIRSSSRDRARAHRVGATLSLVDTASKTASMTNQGA